MVQRMQMECDRCGGKGEVIPDGQRCNGCRATGLKKETKVITVEITRGMKHNEKIVFNEEGDQRPDEVPGDVIVVLKAQEHKTFTRTPDGCHLYVKRSVSLLEALTGFEFVVTHLDGRTLIVQSNPNVIYSDNDVHAIKEEGMPILGGSQHGHLYITIRVEMPRRLTQAQKAQLKNSGLLGAVRTSHDVKAAQARLASQDTSTMTDEDESKQVQSVTLEQVDLEAEKAAYKELLREHHSQYDEDEEDEMEGQQVGCRAQ
jgi:DnaJ family protein A protein 2